MSLRKCDRPGNAKRRFRLNDPQRRNPTSCLRVKCLYKLICDVQKKKEMMTQKNTTFNYAYIYLKTIGQKAQKALVKKHKKTRTTYIQYLIW